MTLLRREAVGETGAIVAADNLMAETRERAARTSEDLLGEFYAAYRNAPPQALSLGEAVIAQFPELRSVWVKVVHLLLGAGEPARAIELAQAGLERFPEEPELLRLCATAAETLQGTAATVPWLQRWAATGKDGGRAHYRLGEYLLRLGDGQGAGDHLAMAETAGYASPNLTALRCQAALLARDPALARSLLPDLSPEEAAAAMREIIGLEVRDREVANARRAGRLRSVSSSQLKAWAESRGLRPGRVGKSDLFVSEDGDLFGERMAGSRAAVLVFGGLKDMVGAGLPKFNKALRARGVSTLYLSDPRRLLMLGGAPSFGSFEQTIEGLRGVLRTWGADRIYCKGMSAGGYPAILYGLELGARRILTMAAPTDLIGSVADEDGRARIVMHRIRAEIDPSKLELRSRLAAAEHPPQIINYYGADSPADVRHALHLEGLPSVSLRPLDGAVGHNVFAAVKARGDYPAVLQEFLADAHS